MKDIEKVIAMLPKKRHSLFFSATMPLDIQKLANAILVNPKKVEVTPAASTVDRIHQVVMYVEKKDKVNLLVHLLKGEKLKKTLVFVGMKHVANRIVQALEKSGISSKAIHGNKTQSARQKAIQEFSTGQINVMVATDIASRGIDIDGITHVINYDLSNLAESYVHRIGRTARAGKEGKAISLVTGDEKSYLANIERTTKQEIEVIIDHPYHSVTAAEASVLSVGKAKAKIEGSRNSPRGRSSRSGSGRPKRRSKSSKQFKP